MRNVPGLRIEVPWLLLAGVSFVACALIGISWFDEKLYESCKIAPAPSGCAPGADVSPFAFVFVAAMLVERLLELLGPWFGATKVEKKDTGMAAPVTKVMTKAGLRVAAATALVSAQPNAEKQIRSNRTALWLIAAGFGILVCAWTNAFLLRSIGADVSGNWDLVATGLIVGGGTKPLHDLISALQKKGDSKPAAGGAAEA